MIFPEMATFTDLSLLMLRVMVGLVFLSSGWSHVRNPVERGEGIGFSPKATVVLGLVEIVGALSVILGVGAQGGAILLVGVMLGAIHRKIFVWETGFWGSDGSGWYYDLLYLVGNLVVITTGGGDWILI